MQAQANVDLGGALNEQNPSLSAHSSVRSAKRDAEIMQCLASTRKISRHEYRKLLVEFIELESGFTARQCKAFVNKHASRRVPA